MKMRLSRAALAVAATALGLSAAQATTTATGTLNVSLSVVASCTVGASALSFGSVSTVGDTPITPGAINVTCTPGTTFTVDLNNGAHPDSTTHQRNMAGTTNPGNLISYDLYVKRDGSALWSPQTQTQSSVGETNIGIYGVAHVGANGSPTDNYADQVLITITY